MGAGASTAHAPRRRVAGLPSAEAVLASVASPASLHPAALVAALVRLAELLPGGADNLRHDERYRALARAVGAAPLRLRSLANACWAFATLGLSPPAFLQAAEAASLAPLSKATASLEDATNLLWAFATLRHRPSEPWLEAAGGVWAAHTAAAPPPPLLAVTRGLWALATLGHSPGSGVDAAVLLVCQEGPPPSKAAPAPTTLAQTLWALAVLRHAPQPAVLRTLAAASAASFAAAAPEDLVTSLWAAASLAAAAVALPATWTAAWDAAAARCDSRRAFDAGQLALLLWSWATLKRSPRTLPARAEAWLAAAEREGIAQAAPDAFAKALWACASAGLRPASFSPGWVERAAALVLPQLAGSDADSLATLLWAFAVMGAHPGDALLAAAADVWLARLRIDGAGVGGQAAANAVWAFAALGHHPGAPWLDSLAAELRPQLATCPPAALAQLIHALGVLSHAPGGGWLAVAADASSDRLDLLTADELAQAVGGFSALAFHPGRPWLEAAGRAASALCDSEDIAPTTLGRLLLGFLVLREHAAASAGPIRSATGAVWAALREIADCGTPLGAEALKALLAAELLLPSEAPELTAAVPGPAPECEAARTAWRSAARSAWAESCRAAAAASAGSPFARDVLNALAHVRPRPRFTPAVLISDTGYPVLAVDATLACRGGGRAALQADGTAAFVRNSRVKTGATLLRDRVSEALGWRVVTVAQHQWPRSQAARLEYLATLLQSVGVL